MKLTETELNSIKELAEHFYTPAEIEIVIELPTGSLEEELENPNSAAFKAFHSGFLKSDFELRKNLKEAANNGSHPAQLQMLKFSNQLKSKLDA
jgi:hypothetical protein